MGTRFFEVVRFTTSTSEAVQWIVSASYHDAGKILAELHSAAPEEGLRQLIAWANDWAAEEDAQDREFLGYSPSRETWGRGPNDADGADPQGTWTAGYGKSRIQVTEVAGGVFLRFFSYLDTEDARQSVRTRAEKAWGTEWVRGQEDRALLEEWRARPAGRVG